MKALCAVSLLLMLGPPAGGPLVAQMWNSAGVDRLVDRATARRAASVDRGYSDFTAHAQGVVLFLAQVGEGFTTDPRLIRADQLALEVYWKAPGASKQRIVGRREQVDLPTDIQYHRDHLGIVQNNYGDRIRIGGCDEICDVPHPLAPGARELYDFAIVDSLRIGFLDRTLDVYEVAIRPRDARQPRVVGTLYLDAATGQVVRLRFGFTRAAYRDDTLEDITVLLDNALWDGRHWLPRYQEIEVRRTSGWLDLPARGIIRTVLTVEDYAFDVGLADSVFTGPEIVQAPESERLAYAWPTTLREVLRALPETAAPATIEEARQRMREIVAESVLSGLPAARPGAGGISDVAHFNRVEGLAVGMGAVLRPGQGRTLLRGWAGYGFGDRRIKARLEISWPAIGLALRGTREVRDVIDRPVTSGVVNSLLAQEAGRDFADYYLREAVALEARRDVGGLVASAAVGVERVRPAAVTVAPARGSFRINPDFGTVDAGFARLQLMADRQGPGPVRWMGRLRGEVGVTSGDTRYGRLSVDATLATTWGGVELNSRLWAGAGTSGLPLHRSFAVGGRGTLVGERFRAWGGRWAASFVTEGLIAIPMPEISLGSFGGTGAHLWVGPYAGVVLAGRPVEALPWEASDGGRPVIGAALEVLHRLLRIEVGYSLRDNRVRGAFDLRRAFWPIL